MLDTAHAFPHLFHICDTHTESYDNTGPYSACMPVLGYKKRKAAFEDLVENILLTCHEDVRSHDLRRSILAKLRIVSNQYTLQPLLLMRGSCHSNRSYDIPLYASLALLPGHRNYNYFQHHPIP